MDAAFLIVAAFFAGAAAGALCRYLQDLHLLRLYGDLVRLLAARLNS